MHKTWVVGEVLWFPLGEVHHLVVGFKELGFTEDFARKRSIRILRSRDHAARKGRISCIILRSFCEIGQDVRSHDGEERGWQESGRYDVEEDEWRTERWTESGGEEGEERREDEV